MEWKTLKGYENFYLISEYGHIKSIDRVEETNGRFGPMKRKRKGREIKPQLEKNGYYFIELNANKKSKRFSIHKLVYENFIGDIEKGNVIHHKDFDKVNNHYSNLEQMDFTTHNRIHAHPSWNKGIKNPKKMVENARKAREENFILKCREVYEMSFLGASNKEISECLGICERTVSHRRKRYKEYYNL